MANSIQTIFLYGLQPTQPDKEGICCSVSPTVTCSSCEMSDYNHPRQQHTLPVYCHLDNVDTNLQKQHLFVKHD